MSQSQGQIILTFKNVSLWSLLNREFSLRRNESILINSLLKTDKQDIFFLFSIATDWLMALAFGLVCRVQKSLLRNSQLFGLSNPTNITCNLFSLLFFFSVGTHCFTNLKRRPVIVSPLNDYVHWRNPGILEQKCKLSVRLCI